MPSPLVDRVTERINELVEEETSRKIGELNIVSEVSELPDGTIKIRFTPLSPYSPIAVATGRELRDASMGVDGVKHVTVECVGHMQDELVNRLVNKQAKP